MTWVPRFETRLFIRGDGQREARMPADIGAIENKQQKGLRAARLRRPTMHDMGRAELPLCPKWTLTLVNAKVVSCIQGVA
jgi:hypothetical protein